MFFKLISISFSTKGEDIMKELKDFFKKWMECLIFEIIGVYLLKIKGVPILDITTKDPSRWKHG